MSLKLKLRPVKILETLNFARKHQLPADPWFSETQQKIKK